MNLIPNSLLLLNRWHKQLWLWPSSFCTHNHPKTLSFRATTTTHDDRPNYQLLFNKQDRHQLLLEPPEVVEQLATLGSCFTTQYSSESASIINSTEESDDDDFETIVRGASWSERLFFEPDPTSSIVLDETQSRLQGSSSTSSQCASTDENINGGGGGGLAYYKERTSSVAMVMESENPYVDFKKSMAEMVEIHHDLVKDWDCLEELLGWYLRMNGKNNHHFIYEAFVDLLIAGFSSSDAVSCLDRSKASFTTSTFSSPISSSALSHGN